MRTTLPALFSPLLLATGLLAGCDLGQQLRENFDQSSLVIAELKQKTGAESTMASSSINGKLMYVHVTFATPPKKYTTDELARIINKSTIRHFKQQPKTIVIGFVVE